MIIEDYPSPNQEDRPAGAPIDMLLLHYTGMQSAEAAIQRLRDPAPPTGIRVSSHYVVDEEGNIYNLVPERRRAFHAGISFWRGRQTLNDYTIGIEIVNPGHEWGYTDFPPSQIASVRALCLDILGRRRIPPINVVAHSDVAPDRKQDPGERFPWRDLALDGIGLWPDVPDLGTADIGDAETVRADLLRLGFAPGPDLPTLLRAFQRHWRPEAVTGQPDAGTRARLSALLRLID